MAHSADLSPALATEHHNAFRTGVLLPSRSVSRYSSIRNDRRRVFVSRVLPHTPFRAIRPRVFTLTWRRAAVGSGDLVFLDIRYSRGVGGVGALFNLGMR